MKKGIGAGFSTIKCPECNEDTIDSVVIKEIDHHCSNCSALITKQPNPKLLAIGIFIIISTTTVTRYLNHHLFQKLYNENIAIEGISALIIFLPSILLFIFMLLAGSRLLKKEHVIEHKKYKKDSIRSVLGLCLASGVLYAMLFFL